MTRRQSLLTASLIACGVALAGPAWAQSGVLHANTQQQSTLSGSEPVTFTADQVEYDRDHALVTATGHVEAWQNGNTLYADKVIFDRNTNVAAASGNVILLQPDGQVVFSDYAELTQGMRDAVMKGMRALLAENGRLAANGARRTEGKINELSRVVYSTCNLCKKDPTRPPLWQLRAYSAVEDLEHQRVEYQDAWLDMFGIPVAYFPYFWHVDPSVKRASGLLVPNLGNSSHIGTFASVPYYWVLDDQSDVIITPTMTTLDGPQLDLNYRRMFNDGKLTMDGSFAYYDKETQAALFAAGQFALDENWRYGFTVQRATSSTYLRDFSVKGSNDEYLTSQIYLEGFGEGAYTRLDSRIYQGLNSQVVHNVLPLVLPHYSYSFFGEPDAWGGRTTVDFSAFNVMRDLGTNTQRAALSVNWDRPFDGYFGDEWKFTTHVDSAGYSASQMNLVPNYSSLSSSSTARAEPTVALQGQWLLQRNSTNWGQQIIEPIVQVIAAPDTGSSGNYRIPNEDSLDLEFTDANLFALNRFPGLDRLEGGERANVGLHTAWHMPDGMSLDNLVGQSYKANRDDTFPVGSGLENPVSDIVARSTFIPTDWLDITARGRFAPATLTPHFGELVAGTGNAAFHLTGGYLYTATDPSFLYDAPPSPTNTLATSTPRNEITAGVSTKYGNYKFTGNARRDLQSNQMVSAGGDVSYEDECFIFDLSVYRRYTSLDGDNGATTVLFQLTFKTVGQFGFHAF